MSKMKSGTLCAAALISLFTGGGIATTRAAQAPNIIIIMADDLTRAASSTGGRPKNRIQLLLLFLLKSRWFMPVRLAPAASARSSSVLACTSTSAADCADAARRPARLLGKLRRGRAGVAQVVNSCQ